MKIEFKIKCIFGINGNTLFGRVGKIIYFCNENLSDPGPSIKIKGGCNTFK